MTTKIFICGFMGSGKTTIGRLLAKQLGYAFTDTDQMIEEQLSTTISDIFKSQSEAFFRKQERQVIRKLIATPDPNVIALGGGSLLDADNVSLILNSGALIFLKCDINILKERLRSTTGRPLLETDDWDLLYHRRLVNYESASITVDVTGKTPGYIIEDIITQLRNINALIIQTK